MLDEETYYLGLFVSHFISLLALWEFDGTG